MECVNLKERFGKRYRVRHEESYRAARGNRAWADDPWLQIVPCQHGHVFPHGVDMLAASTDRSGSIARRLKALPGVAVWQAGSDGATVLFPVGMIDQVAAIMLPKRRRRLSEAARAQLAAAGAKTRFAPGVGAPKTSAVCVPAG